MATNVGSIFADFFINTDPFAKGMARVQEIQARALGQMQQKALGAGDTISGLRARLEMLNSRLDRTAIGSRNFDILKQKIAETQAQLQKAQAGMGGFADRIQQIGNVIRGGLAAAGVTGLAKMGMELEQTEVQFEVFLKSAEKAKQVIKELNSFANVTPFENKDVLESGKRLLAAGVAAEDLTKNLRMLGDIASGSNVPLNDLAQVFAKMKTTDIIQAEELNQLERFGPVLGGLADSMGLSMRELKQRASEGKVSFADLQAGMQKMTGQGGIFFGMMDKQAETAAGKWSTMTGTIESISMKVGYLVSEALKPLLDIGNKVLEWVDGMAESVKNWYQDLDPAQQKVLQVVGALGLLAVAGWALQPVIMGLGASMMTTIKGVTVAMATNPILLAIMAIIGGVVLMTSTFQRWKSVFDPVIAQGTKLRDSLLPAFNKIMQFVDLMKAKFNQLMAAFGGTGLGKTIGQFSALTLVVRTIAAVFGLVVNSVIGGFQLIVDSINLVIANLQMWWDVLVQIKEGVVQLFTDPLNVDAWAAMGEKFADKMKGHFSEVDKSARTLVSNVGNHIKSQGDIMMSIVAQPEVRPGKPEGVPFTPGRDNNNRSGTDVKALEDARNRLVDAWKNANKETFDAIGASEVLLRNNTVESIGGIHKAIIAANIPASLKMEFEQVVSEFFESTEDGASSAMERIRGILKNRAGIGEELATRAMPGIVEALKKTGEERNAALNEALKAAPLNWSMRQVWHQQVLAELSSMPPIVLKTDADATGAKERLIEILKQISEKTRIPISDLIGFDPKDVAQLNKFVDRVLEQKNRIAKIDKEIAELRTQELDESEKIGTIREQELQKEIEIGKKLREKHQIQKILVGLAEDAARRQSQEVGLREYILRLEKEIAIARRTGNTKEAGEKEDLKKSAEGQQQEKFESIVGKGIKEPVDGMIEKLGEIDAAAKDLSFGQIFAAKAATFVAGVNGMIQKLGELAKQYADAFSKLTEVAQQKFARKFEIGSYFVDLYQRYEQKKLQEQIDSIREAEDAKIEELRRGVEIRKAMFDEEYESRKKQLEAQKAAEIEALRISYEAQVAKLHKESADKEQAMIADDLMAKDYKDAQAALEQAHADRLAALAEEINGKKETDKKTADDRIAALEAQKNARIDELEKQKNEKEKSNKKQNATMKWMFESASLEMGKAAQILQLKVTGITSAAQAMAGAIASFASLGPPGIAIGTAVGLKLASMIMSATTGAIGLVASQFVLPPPEVLGLATGGVLRGPGGPTDDLINARLSNNEAVIDAARTEKLLGAADNITRIANNADRYISGPSMTFMSGAIVINGYGNMDEALADRVSVIVAGRIKQSFESNYGSFGI